MTASFGAAVSDVLWSLGFLARHAWPILLLSGIPAAQRIFASFYPDDSRLHAWPVEMLVAALRLGSIAVVFWLGWRDDASVRRGGLGSGGEIFRAIGTYVREDLSRFLLAVVLAIVVFSVLNVLGGPVAEKVVGLFSDDVRVAEAWNFGIRNLIIIPLFYVLAFGLVRPAFVTSGT